MANTPNDSGLMLASETYLRLLLEQTSPALLFFHDLSRSAAREMLRYSRARL